MLKITVIKLDLITDPDIYIFFGKCARNEICDGSNIDTKAKSKYLKDYNQK